MDSFRESLGLLSEDGDIELIPLRRRIRFVFAWYDMWIGAYYDRTKRQLYILPFPCIGIALDLRCKETINDYRIINF